VQHAEQAPCMTPGLALAPTADASGGHMWTPLLGITTKHKHCLLHRWGHCSQMDVRQGSMQTDHS